MMRNVGIFDEWRNSDEQMTKKNTMLFGKLTENFQKIV